MKHLSDGCLLSISQQMIRSEAFMDILDQAKPDYALHVEETVLTTNTVQDIDNCTNDSAAWAKIRQVSFY